MIMREEELEVKSEETLYISHGKFSGLLASCRLTNLLLYQLLQLRGGTLGLSPNVPNAQNLQHSPAAGGIVNNFLFPPRLTTYLSTSTITKQLTSTSVVTIPLLFGHKRSPTTITRTKTYEVTSSEIHTITTTIQPSSTTLAVTPTALVSTFTTPTTPLQPLRAEPENDIEEFQYEEPEHTPQLHSKERPEEFNTFSKKYASRNRIRNRHQTSPISPPRAPSKFNIRNKERKILRANPATTENFVHADFTERTPAYKYGPESYTRRKYKQTSREEFYVEPNVDGMPREEPYGFAYEDERLHNFYTRRLKRRDDTDEESDEYLHYDREYLLEPSFNADSSYGFQHELKCPPPVEVTITKTITKFVNPPAAVAATTEKPFRKNDSERRFQPKKERVFSANRRFQLQAPSENVEEHRIRPTPSSAYNHSRGTKPPPTESPRRSTRRRGDILNRARNSSPTPSSAEAQPNRFRNRFEAHRVESRRFDTGKITQVESPRTRQRRRKLLPRPDSY